jgi:hypothetical protein
LPAGHSWLTAPSVAKMRGESGWELRALDETSRSSLRASLQSFVSVVRLAVSVSARYLRVGPLAIDQQVEVGLSKFRDLVGWNLKTDRL